MLSIDQVNGISNLHEHRPSIAFTVRSSLPVGAGLGSSAAFSTCVASSILLVHRLIPLPVTVQPTNAPQDNNPGHTHVSHQGRRAIAHDTAEEVNKWAFLSEKVLHGNPSGVDNSVSVFGGALAFTRPGFGKPGGIEPISG